MPECCSGVCSILCRRNTVDVKHVYDTQLKRCLNIVDLIALGKQCFLYQMYLSLFSVIERLLYFSWLTDIICPLTLKSTKAFHDKMNVFGK